MRLQKFLALGAVNSRRKAEELILSGAVAINGAVAKIGDCVDPKKDAISVDGEIISAKKNSQGLLPVVLIVNKPIGYVCSHSDRYNFKTIFDLIPKTFARKKLMICGRLDKETEGMVIVTDDGSFAQRLTHPSFGIRKHYEAVLSCPLAGKVIKEMLKGIEDMGEFLKFDKIIPIGHGNMKSFVFEIVLSHGKKNEIHRVFERFGIFVKKLKRTKIGGLKLKGIALGRCKQLSEKEIETLINGRLSVGKSEGPLQKDVKSPKLDINFMLSKLS